MEQFILAIDQGTTSSRAIVFDHAGNIRASAQKEFTQHFPQPGWVEHDADEIWSTQIGVMHEALAQADLNAKQIAAIGITNQRETALLWDRQTGKPLAPAIVWQDRRTAGICEKLKSDGHETLFRDKTGLVIDSYFSGTKVLWMLENIPGLRERAERGEIAFGTVDSWLIWKLTQGQVHVTDVSNASRTLLYDIKAEKWSDEILGILNIPAAILPEVRSSSEVYAHCHEDHFSAPIPIAGIAGDQQAALFGQMCTQAGRVKNTYGTGCFMLMNIGEQAIPSKHKLLTTIAWKIQGKTEYALEGSIFIAGAVVQWLRDGLGLIRSASEIEALALSVPDNGGVYLVPAFAGLGAPHWDPYARGILAGITRGTKAGHLARAALEGIAYQVSDILDVMKADSGIGLQELRVDGGAATNDLLMQFQSDMLGVPVLRPKTLETTALGAAYLAGLAVGYWKNTKEISEQWQMDRSFTPQMAENLRLSHKAKWTKALERSRAWEESDPI